MMVMLMTAAIMVMMPMAFLVMAVVMLMAFLIVIVVVMPMAFLVMACLLYTSHGGILLHRGKYLIPVNINTAQGQRL